MRAALLLLAILPASLAPLPAAARGGDVRPLRPATPEILRAWQVSDPAAQAVAQREVYLRSEPLPLLSYPGQRDVFNNTGSGSVDITRVDTRVYLDRNTPNFLRVATQVTLVALKEDVMNLSFSLEVPELVSITSSGPGINTATLEGSTLAVLFSAPLPVEKEVVLDLEYQGQMDCSTKFMLPTCRLEGGIWYVTHSQFLPMLGGYDQKFLGTMRVFVGGKDYQAYNVGGTGVFTGSFTHPDQAMNEFVFEHTFHTALYAFSMGPFQRISASWNDTPLSVLLLKDQAKNAGAMLGLAESALAHHSQMFAQYPWGKFDLVEMPDSFSGGFGPISTIMMARFAFDAAPDNNSYWSSMLLVSHETGHQWWGNLVDMADTASVIVSEGLAEFSSNFHFENTTGSRYGFIQDSMSYMYTVPHDEEPYIISPFVYNSTYYFQVVYYKGSQIFEMLRLELGQEVLLSALQQFISKFFQQYASVQDLFDVLEEVAGQDLDWFYTQWLEGKGYIRATLDGTYDPDAGLFHLHVTQDPAKSYQFTLPLFFEARDGSFTSQNVKVTSPDATFDVPVQQEVVRVSPDRYRVQMRRFIPARPGDIDLSGVVDGEDLVEMSFAYQMNIMMGQGWGAWFFANGNYNDLADLAGEDGPGDVDGRVDAADLAVLFDAMK